ncbi:hypothetical protein EAN04_24545 [Salmonella enterica]|nr:hypothetical protein [Salmonella enterica]
MANYNIKISASTQLLASFNKDVYPRLSKSVDVVGQKIASRWVDEVYKAKLWSGEKDAYAQSISWKMTGPLSGEVVASYKYASDIESGRPARDLKRMLGTSLKVRRTTKGQRFLVIPFRHNVKSMPPALYEQAKALEASTVTGMGERRSGEITALSPQFGMRPLGEKRQKRSPFLSNPSSKGAMMVKQAQYQWGGRIAAGFFGPNPKGKTDMAAGMVRFDTSSGKAKSSAYLTFRIMSEKSQGWIVPPQPGQFIAKRVVENIRPHAEKLFAGAMALDEE